MIEEDNLRRSNAGSPNGVSECPCALGYLSLRIMYFGEHMREEEFIKKLSTCADDTWNVDYDKLKRITGLDDLEVAAYLKENISKGYVIMTNEEIILSERGREAHRKTNVPSKLKRVFLYFSELTLKRVVDIFVGFITGIIASYITSHFLWK